MVKAGGDEEVGVEVKLTLVEGLGGGACARVLAVFEAVAVELELEVDVEDPCVLVVALVGLILDEDVIDVDNDALVRLVGVCEDIIVEFASRS